MIKKALLLAAGKGTRLWPLTEVRAKAAVPFRNTPLVRWIAESLIRSGITGIAVNLHHLPGTVRTALDGVPVTFSEEEELLGTSGALYPLRTFFADESFLTINAKIWCPLFPPVVELDLPEDAIIGAMLSPAPRGSPYTCVEISSDSRRVIGFKSAEKHDGTGYVFTGMQVANTAIWDYLPPPGFSHFPEMYPTIWRSGKQVSALIYKGPWYEFSTLSRYLAQHLIAGDGVRFWGRDCRVHRPENVIGTVMWDNVVVEPGARVHHCIIADNVVIQDGRDLDNVAVIPLSACGGERRGGEVMDDNLVVRID